MPERERHFLEQQNEQPSFAGLRRLNDGQWLDPKTGHVFNPVRTRNPHVLRAEEEWQRQQMQQSQQGPAGPDMRAIEFAARQQQMEQQQGTLREQADYWNQNLPQIIEARSRMMREVMAELPENMDGGVNPDDFQRALMAREGFSNLESAMEAGQNFFQANPGMRRFEVPQSAPQGNTEALGAAFLAENDSDLPPEIRDQFRIPVQMRREQAQQALAEFQSQLPEGTPEERRAFAEQQQMPDGTTLADNIIQAHELLQSIPQPQGFTRDQIGVTDPSLTLGVDGQPHLVEPLTPEQRGFTMQPEGTYRPGSAIGGIPSLDVMRRLEENAADAQPRQYRGELVPDNERFAPQPEGFRRFAQGEEGGGTTVTDMKTDPNAPRFGTWQSPDGTWGGLGRQGNRTGFATEEEAQQWSIANMQQAEPRAITLPWGNGRNGAPTPFIQSPPSMGESFRQGGLFGPGGVFRSPKENQEVERQTRLNPMSGGGGSGEGLGIVSLPFARQLFGSEVGDQRDAYKEQIRASNQQMQRMAAIQRAYNAQPQQRAIVENPSVTPPSWFPSGGSSIPRSAPRPPAPRIEDEQIRQRLGQNVFTSQQEAPAEPEKSPTNRLFRTLPRTIRNEGQPILRGASHYDGSAILGTFGRSETENDRRKQRP